MRKRATAFLFTLLLAASAHAQQWRMFGRGAVFLTHASETGPAEPESRVFSTNWTIVGAERASGRGSILFRGRFTAEEGTVPSEGYPQLFQQSGAFIDHMPGHESIEEIAVQLHWRAFRLYAAAKGDPPLGATPYRQRASSIDFAEAPFAYEVQESFHVAKRVAAAAIETGPLTIEGGVFDLNGNSWSARATLRPVPHVALQASHGSLGDAKQKITSASLGYEGRVVAASALWTRRDPVTVYGVEAIAHGGRNSVMVRAENVRERQHVTVGYIFDVWRGEKKRAGIGANVDYHTKTKSLPDEYGHKPQSIYVFVRARTD
ncbi:MAG: hypothetical protein AABO58_15475 [Acidobacteriota bacterium]